jgi:hypothetical protein
LIEAVEAADPRSAKRAVDRKSARFGSFALPFRTSSSATHLGWSVESSVTSPSASGLVRVAAVSSTAPSNDCSGEKSW